jgi:hypothetical protein
MRKKSKLVSMCISTVSAVLKNKNKGDEKRHPNTSTSRVGIKTCIWIFEPGRGRMEPFCYN